MATMQEPPVVDDGGLALPAPATLQAARLELHVASSIVTGRRRGTYAVAVTNAGTRAVEARLAVLPASARLRADLFPGAVRLAPGEQRLAEVVLRPRLPRLLGGERDHAATVEAQAAADAAAVTRRIVFVQERLVPLWGWLVLVALVAAAAFGATRMPARGVTVPNVVGASDTASAERALRDAGLQLDPALRSRTVPGGAPGTILDQIPAPGARAHRGDRVSLLVVVAAQRSVTPALDGLSAARAADTLRAAGLTAGPVLPDGAAATAVVASQLPVAGQRVPAGTAVTLFTRARAAADPPPGAAAPAARDVRIPALDGRDVHTYARAVAAAGLVPKVIRAVDPAPAGTLVAVRPRPGTSVAAGERVRLLVAAGVPQLALDTGAVVQLFDPRGQRTLREASPPQGSAVEPAWTPDGRRLLYRVGRRLVLVSARLAGNGRVLYDGEDKYAAAAFAPAASASVLALVRRTGSDGDLCFATVGAATLRPRCIADPRWDLGRAISWRPGGRELLVFGVRRGHPGEFGMLRYRTASPFSSDPRDWHGALATDASQPGRGVIAAAYAPDGTDVALVTNIGLPRFQLELTRTDDLRAAGARALPVRACEVAWRPDGGELAVVQSDDACGRPLGQIVRLDPRAPRHTVTVSSGGRHPAYQPLTYSGPKGVS
ncbi:MAG TPA: PASTA domain-containing protein [Solirubrobacteraceae bacterium]|nr:PASTA domain-containing protein [Solirubrobacteraceae bacterium]